MHRQTRDTIPMMNKYRLSVVDGGPTFIQQIMPQCPVIDGNATRKISQHIVTCAVNDET